MFEAGDKVYVKRIGGDWTISEILLKKKLNDTETEYFIHYDGYNRRLDEWVSSNRILTKEGFDRQNEAHTEYKSYVDSPKKMTRQQRRKYNEINHIEKSYSEMDPTTAALEKEYLEKTKIKYINKVVLGEYEMDTWYFSPYPNEYEKVSILYVCEKCLKYMALENNYKIHQNDCAQLTPPGRLIYNKDELKVYEIDGSINKLYCQNLCLLGKLFLDHKTLYYDVTPFLFYVVYEFDKTGYHITSYFSKEKDSIDNYNVACILTFPPYQRKGYGKFLIALSYELSKIENKIGSPEKPLSDLGQMSYRSYWSYVILDYLSTNPLPMLTIDDLSLAVGIAKSDIIETLQTLNLLKYWKGNYIACFSSKTLQQQLKNGNFKPPRMLFEPSCLCISPSENK